MRTATAPIALDLPELGRRRQLISLTPLIDVVFILLVFFMLASNSVDWRAIGFNGADAASVDAAAGGSSALVVRLDADGIITADGQSAPARMAGELVESRLGGDYARPVLLVPQSTVSLQDAVRALDAITAVGVRRVSLSRGQIGAPEQLGPPQASDAAVQP